MAEAVPAKDSPHVANLKFRAKDLSDKIARISAMSDKEFEAGQGMSRSASLEKAQQHLADVQRELKKATK